MECGHPKPISRGCSFLAHAMSSPLGNLLNISFGNRSLSDAKRGAMRGLHHQREALEEAPQDFCKELPFAWCNH